MLIHQIRAAINSILPKVVSLPFNQQLHAGTLEKKIFHSYLKQDCLYLTDSAKACENLAARLTNKKHAFLFAQIAKNNLESERKTHLKYLGRDNNSHKFFQNPIKKIPVVQKYTDHILTASHFSSVEIAVASLMPCYIFYSEMGKINKKISEQDNHPYREWVASYSNHKFFAFTDSILQTMEELDNANPCPIIREQAFSAFMKSSEYEIDFWENVFSENTKIYQPDELFFTRKFKVA